QTCLKSKGDVPFLLDRVAVGQAVRRDIIGEAKLDFSSARHIEAGALTFEHDDDLGGRVRLYSGIDARERQMPAQRLIRLGDNVEIDDEARGLGRAFGKKTGNPFSHQSGHPSCEVAKRSRLLRARAEAEPGAPSDTASVRPNANRNGYRR